MSISTINEGDEIKIILDKPLDALYAKELEACIAENIDNTDVLIIDFGACDYVASAGLRVIMKADMEIKTHGVLKLVNVSDMVLSILKVVNFHKFLSINDEKAEEDKVEEDIEISYEKYSLTEEDKAKISCVALSKLLKATAVVYGAVDEDDNMIAFAICNSKYAAKTFSIEYIYIEEEYKNKGIEAKLIEYIVDKCDAKNFREVKLILAAEGDELKYVKKIAKDAGFEGGQAGGELITYTPEEIKNSKIFKHSKEMLAMASDVKMLNSLDELQLFDISLALEVEASDLDPVFTRFYITKDKVAGMISAVEVVEDKVVLDRMVLNIDEGTKNALPLMLTSLITTYMDVTSDNSTFYIDCVNAKYVKGLELLLGQSQDVKKYIMFERMV